MEASVETTITKIAPGLTRLSQPMGDVKGSVFPEFYTISTNNAYLIEGSDKHMLYLAGYKKGFQSLRAAVKSLIGDTKKIGYIALNVWASDQMGALRLWLDECPDAVIVCSRGMVETRTKAKGITRVKVMTHGETLDLGQGKVIEWVDAPNCFFNGPECGFLFERSTRSIFCADLFSHTGPVIPSLSNPQLVLDESEKLVFNFSDPRVPGYFKMLREMKPKVLATMHGGTFIASSDEECDRVMGGWSEMHLRFQREKDAKKRKLGLLDDAAGQEQQARL